MKRTALALFILVMLVPIYSWVTSSPSQNSLTFKPYSSPLDAIQGLRNGEVDLLPIDSVTTEIASQLNISSLNVIPIQNFGFTYIGLNLRNAPLNDTNLRKAMLYGFNRAKLPSSVLGGFGESLNPGLYSSAYASLGWRNNTLNSYDYNPAMAMQLLNNSGYRNSSGQFRIDPATGKQLREIFILSRLADAADVAAADSFARDMQAIGLPIYNFPLTNTDFDTQVERTYVFDLYIDSVSQDFGQKWLNDMFAGNNDIAPVPLGSNLVGYHSAHFDSCATQLMSTVNQNAAKEQSKQCQGILSEDLPVLPVYSKYALVVTTLDPSLIVPVTGSLTETIKRTALRVQQTLNSNGHIRIGVIGEYSNLDPTSTSSPADWTIINLLTEHLLTINSDGSPAPALAEGWTTSDGAERITFVLRGNLTYSDGEQMSSEDFRATLNWLMVNVKPSSPLFSTLNQIKNFTTPDGSTLQITLREPNSFAASLLGSLFPLPQHRLALSTNMFDPFGFLRSNILVESSQFIMIAFDQRNGVSLQIENLSTPLIGTTETIYTTGGIVNDLGQIHIGTSANTPSGPIMNASFTVYVYRNDSTLARVLNGSYIGHGVYSAMFDSQESTMNEGRYRVETQLFGVLPIGMFIIFSHETLVVQKTLPVTIPAIAILLGTIAVALTRLPSMTPQARRPRTQARRKPPR